MHPLEKLWNLARGLKKAETEGKISFGDLKARILAALTKLGIYEDFDWGQMVSYINNSLRTGEPFWNYYDEDEADSWVIPPDEADPPVPDFTQPPPNINSVTGEILDDDPRSTKRTK